MKSLLLLTAFVVLFTGAACSSSSSDKPPPIAPTANPVRAQTPVAIAIPWLGETRWIANTGGEGTFGNAIAPTSSAAEGGTPNREKKISQYKDGVEGVGGLIGDLSVFDDLCDAIDDDKPTSGRLSRVKSSSPTEMWLTLKATHLPEGLEMKTIASGLGRCADWVLLEAPDGLAVWVNARYLSAIQPAVVASETATSPPTPSPTLTSTVTATPTSSDGTRARLSRVIDGDTIDVDIEGQIKRVRLILIDTPEVHGAVECYGAEASAYVESLVPVGAVMTLESDVSDRDRYGRLLRYVYLSDGRMLNEVLVRDGYATLATYPPDLKYVDRIRSAEQYARDNGLGLWSACAATSTQTAGNCDPSYPDVCIPPKPPDLNCDDIPFRDFRVLPPDPHRFDGNKDGIGCQG